MKKILKKYWFIMVVIMCIVTMIIVTNYEGEKEVVLNESKSFEEIKTDEKEIVENDQCETDTFYIDIKGEVKKPGVYEISSDKRVIDVINMAGGFTKDADISILNLSKKLKDEMSIIIYSKKEIEDIKNSLTKEPEVIEIIKEVEKVIEVEKECLCETNNICIENNEILINKETNDESTNNINENKLVNINTATKEELMSVSGIGESKAIKIIEYRNKTKFEKIEDIMNVSGIGNAMFEKIKEYITV